MNPIPLNLVVIVYDVGPLGIAHAQFRQFFVSVNFFIFHFRFFDFRCDLVSILATQGPPISRKMRRFMPEQQNSVVLFCIGWGGLIGVCPDGQAASCMGRCMGGGAWVYGGGGDVLGCLSPYTHAQPPMHQPMHRAACSSGNTLIRPPHLYRTALHYTAAQASRFVPYYCVNLNVPTIVYFLILLPILQILFFIIK